ncbi:MAG: tyrosine-type recombinase/integrase [Bacteriovoracales bacterium]|nr:tyrosine-type recombinase/integrase [Bacteriovoracales bacterium]
MEKMRNKSGRIVSYREKVYVDGKAVTKTFKRRSDALSWKRNIQLEQQRRESLGIGHIRSIDFEEYSKLWFEMKEDQGMARRTIDNFRSSLKNYLIPSLGKTRLEKINHAKGLGIIRLCKQRGLGAVRTNTNLTILQQMLNDAVRLDYLVRNPLKGMKKIKVPPRALRYWLPVQVEQFLSKNFDNPLYPIFALALNTGMRRGELMGLCWDKVNLESRILEISRVRDRYGLKDTTKTGAIRHIPLNDAALEVLTGLSRDKNHEVFTFAHQNGSLPDVPHLSDRHFKKAVERAGVPRIRFHDLRTTYASNFVMAGGDIFALSKILGHTSVEMTAKKYAALHPSYMKETVNTVQFGASRTNFCGPKLSRVK